MILPGQDDMIVNLDSQKPARLDQLFGDPEIFLAGARISTRVIVDQDDSCRRFQQGLPEYISRMNNARIEGSFGDEDFFDQPIGPAEKEDFEDLFP